MKPEFKEGFDEKERARIADIFGRMVYTVSSLKEGKRLLAQGISLHAWRRGPALLHSDMAQNMVTTLTTVTQFHILWPSLVDSR
jgi:hypothetical protein